MKKILVNFAIFALLMAPVFALGQDASANQFNPWGNNSVRANAEGSIGLGNSDPREMAASVVNIMLGFLGIIAVVIILLAGFKWMTAGGNEDAVGEAKSMLAAGVIGLIIILMAWALATFVLDALIDATT